MESNWPANIAIGNTSHIIARNNLIYSCHTAGISIGGYDEKRGSTHDTVIVNNTLYKNDAWHTGTGEIQMQFYLRNNIFKNNIVYIGDSNHGPKKSIWPHGPQYSDRDV